MCKTTENTVTDRGELYDELDRIQEQGYATEHEERTKGLACIAAPIVLDEELLEAISISAPTCRLGRDGVDEEIIAEVQSTANEPSLDIQYKSRRTGPTASDCIGVLTPSVVGLSGVGFPGEPGGHVGDQVLLAPDDLHLAEFDQDLARIDAVGFAGLTGVPEKRRVHPGVPH